jgi:hypothetical protein
MKAFKVIFQHGHFIDQETQKRILPVQGKEFIITASPDAFTTEDSRLTIRLSKNEEEKAAWVKKEYALTKTHKLASAGDQFLFRVGNSRMIEGDENNQYVFLCNLQEDLYLYLLIGKEAKEPKNWRLAECNCSLIQCLLGGLTLTEKLEAQSLNQLFTRTVMHYFTNQRSGSTNALNTFFWYDPKKELTFHTLLNDHYKSLGKSRKEHVVSLNKNK